MPRFVILRHELPADQPRRSHWDLMLEHSQGLLTWALDQEPCFGRTIAADRLAEHRLAYLDYEGPLSQGRGQVARWDHGEFVWQQQDADQIVAVLCGKRIQAVVRLTRNAATEKWRFEAAPVESAGSTRDD